MAGVYPDVPAQRLAYDIDGTAVFSNNITVGTVSLLSESQKQALNDENSNTSITSFGENRIVFIFPEITKIYGYLWNFSGSFSLNAPVISYSANTTNGIDGTWTNLPTPSNVSSSSPTYRASITTLATPLDMKGIRFYLTDTYGGSYYTVYYSGIHLYGIPNVAQKLDFWHPTLDERITPAYFDFGDVAQGTSSVKTFRLKNFSTQSAADVSISINVLTEKNPTTASQHLLSLDNINWYPYIDLLETGNIAINSVNSSPDNISPVIYFKRNTNISSEVGPYTGRLVANVGTWI